MDMPKTDMTLDVQEHGDVVVVAVSGEIDLATAPRLREQFVELISGGARQLVGDLEAVDFLDSTGLGVLVAALKRARSVGGDVSLVCTQERILKVFDITGLTKVFTIHESVEDALGTAKPS